MSTVTISRRGVNPPRLREQGPRPQESAAWINSGAFILMHFACLAVLFTDANVRALVL